MIDGSVSANGRAVARPRRTSGQTTYFVIDGHAGHLTTTSGPDGRPMEVTLRFGKHGSTLAGLTDALGQAITVGLQAGVPIEEYVSAFAGTHFAPAGRTDDPELPLTTSVLDYVGRRLEGSERTG